MEQPTGADDLRMPSIRRTLHRYVDQLTSGCGDPIQDETRSIGAARRHSSAVATRQNTYTTIIHTVTIVLHEPREYPRF